MAAAESKPNGPAPGPAPSGPVPGGFASWGDLMGMQQKLNAAAERIVAANGAGFAGIVAAPENRELRVYWKGATGQRTDALVAELNKTVPVKVLPANYSQKTLLGEAERLAKKAGVRSVAPKADGSGLAVGVDRSVRAEALTSSVPVEQTDAAPTPAFSRGNDSPPYWGGANWFSPLGGCSTGFAVWHAGVTKMLSAAHCARNGDAAHDGGGDLMGFVEHDDEPWDTLLINTNSAGRVYDGGVGVNEFSKPVDSAEGNFEGNWICTSGAYSGAHCNIQVKRVNLTILLRAGSIIYEVHGQVEAEQIHHVAPVGNGDSGGPVFGLTPDFNRMIAKGTLTAIDRDNTEAPCQGTPGSQTRRCAWRFYYADIGHTLPRLGAAIVTG